jgi:hypothetical protein
MVASSRALAPLALALFLAAGGAASQESPAEPREGAVIAKTEAGKADEDRAALVVTSSVKVASVELNRAYVGKVIYSDEALFPGTYLVAVSAPGYATLEYRVELVEKTKTSLHFVLARATGFLSVSVEPSDAELLVDGEPAAGTELELATGRHELLARRFGYEEKRASVLVAEKERSSVALALPAAAFALRDLRISRPSFNPANAGASGSTIVRFIVTGPGSARLEIRDAAGSLVAQADFPDLASWDQSYEWRGRDPQGMALPDGEYLVRVVASPVEAPAGAAAPLALSASVRIDSSIATGPAGGLAAMPGTLLFPDPMKRRGGEAELAWLFPDSSLAGSVLGLGASAALGDGVLLGIGAAAEMNEGPEADLDLSLLVSIARGSRLALAAFARGSWSSAADPLLPDSKPGAELSLPASLSLGSLGLGLSPGLLVDLSSSSPSVSPIARGGAWLSGPTYRAGISAALSLGGEGGFFSPSWPAELCAEARILLPPSPLTASAYALASLEPGASPSFAFGLGLGFAL